MKRPLPLIICDTKHDACYLKNVIQRITFFGVEMIRVEGKIHLFVDECNYFKAKIIVSTQMAYLPSVQAKKRILEKEKLAMEANDSIEVSGVQRVLEGLFFRLDILIEKTIHLKVSN